jgi:RNA polymerase sigma-70 factor (ECF subfamily)
METSSVVENSSEFHGEGTATGTAKNPGRCYDYPAENAAGDDHLFVVEAKSGNASAFGALCERYSSKIYRAAFRTLRNRQDAEDAVQRSFQRAFTNLVRFREDASFSTWITRIAINEALMLLRQRRLNKVLSGKDNEGADAHRALDPTDKQPTPEQALAKKEMRGALVLAVSKLRPRLRVVVLLRELHGLTIAETARRLGLSVSTVKARTLQAKRHLRRHFEGKYEGARAVLYNEGCNHGC